MTTNLASTDCKAKRATTGHKKAGGRPRILAERKQNMAMAFPEELLEGIRRERVIAYNNRDMLSEETDADLMIRLIKTGLPVVEANPIDCFQGMVDPIIRGRPSWGRSNRRFAFRLELSIVRRIEGIRRAGEEKSAAMRRCALVGLKIVSQQ